MRRSVLTLLLSLGLTMPAFQPAHATAAAEKFAVRSIMPNSFADVVETLLPAVVNISSTQRAKPSEMPNMALPPGLEGTPFEDMMKDFMQQYGQGGQFQMQTQPAASLGSGFIIDADKGYVITNNHVVAGADEVRVTLHDDTSLPATVVGRDEKVDIAVLQVKTDKKLSAVKFGDSSKLRVGDWVLAIGNPFGLGGTVTAGIVSAESRNINAGPYDDFIQTDASINRGNSGGPMFDTDGNVIGINTAIFSPSGGGSVGIGFAVPSNLAKPVVDQILKYGHTRRGWIGVKIQSITPDISDSLKLDGTKGALIASVAPGSPAQKAGLKSGDVILEFDGRAIDAMRTLPRAVAETEIDKKVKLVYWRDGKKQDTTVQLGELEKAEKDTQDDDSDNDQPPVDTHTDNGVKISGIGMTVDSINAIDRRNYNIPAEVKGALVTSVEPMSEAAEKGLTQGDVITEINKTPVTTPGNVSTLMDSARKSGLTSILLMVNRGGDVRFIALKPKTGK